MNKILTGTFNKMLLVTSFVVLSVNISMAQAKEKTPVSKENNSSQSQFMRVIKVEDDGKGKSNEPVLSTNKSNNTNGNATTNTPSPIVQPNYEEMSKGRVKAVAEEDDTFAKAVPVTYVGEEKNMTAVNYAIDSQQSNFDNLTNMIDVRNKVHASDNHATLTQTAKYTQLLSDITAYREKFNADVNKKGFENCSKREQSLFLSFLKQEGKKEK